jgi:hypothetical protein
MHRCLQSWYACLLVHAALFYDKCWLTNFCTFLQIWVLLIIASSELPFNRWARISTDYSLMGQAQLIRKLTVSGQLRSFGRYQIRQNFHCKVSEFGSMNSETVRAGPVLEAMPGGRDSQNYKGSPLTTGLLWQRPCTICVTREMPIKHRHGRMYILSSLHDSIPNTCPIRILNLVSPTNMRSPNWELV